MGHWTRDILIIIGAVSLVLAMASYLFPTVRRFLRFVYALFTVLIPTQRLFGPFRRSPSLTVGTVALIFSAVVALLPIRHYLPRVSDSTDRATLVIGSLAAAATLITGGGALFVALLGNERQERQEHNRTRPVIYAQVKWAPVHGHYKAKPFAKLRGRSL